MDPEVKEALETLIQTVNNHINDPRHAEEHEWIRRWIERDNRRARLMEAIIEKSLAGLIWTGLVTLGMAVWSYVKDHIK